MSNITDDFYRDIWQTRMREIQGAIILASLSQVCPQNKTCPSGTALSGFRAVCVCVGYTERQINEQRNRQTA